ncbi:MAG: glycosyltransferase family 39 protein, partial [Elusimicrobiota bacterium]|nr:glycosyltransferase family 39 protein [Elusimicrobiota bacterium]
LAARLLFFTIFIDKPLTGDVPGFLNRAEQITSFYEASGREPLWILWVKTVTSGEGDTKTALQLSNIILSVLAGIMVFLILKRLLGEIPALAGSALYLFIPYMLYSPLRAHRLEIYLLLLLLFTYFALFKMAEYYGAIWTGIISAALLLVRMESSLIITAGLIYIIFTISKKRILKTLLFIILPLLTLAGPFYLNCKLQKGSFFYVINRHSRFYTKYEQPKSKPVKPYEKEAGKDIAGKDTSLAGYLFKSRGLTGMLKRFAGGYWEAATGAGRHLLSTPVNLGFLIYFIWTGLLSMLFFKEGRVLLFWGLLYLLPHVFILPGRVAGYSSVDIRFAAPVSVLFAFSFASLFYIVSIAAGRFAGKNKKSVDF